jgi:hypothetical protein
MKDLKISIETQQGKDTGEFTFPKKKNQEADEMTTTRTLAHSLDVFNIL